MFLFFISFESFFYFVCSSAVKQLERVTFSSHGTVRAARCSMRKTLKDRVSMPVLGDSFGRQRAETRWLCITPYVLIGCAVVYGCPGLLGWGFVFKHASHWQQIGSIATNDMGHWEG